MATLLIFGLCFAPVVTALRGQSYTFSTASTALNNIGGVAVDGSGAIYVSGYSTPVIYRLTPAGAIAAQYGGGPAGTTDGPAAAARFNSPRGLAFDGAGNLYVADTNNHTIRRITPAGDVSTFAGSPGTAGHADGAGASARFHYPQGLAFDRAGNLYVTDTNNHVIRRVTPERIVSTFAGTPGRAGSADGPAATAQFNLPIGLAIDGAGNLHVADTTNHTIRRVTPGGAVSTVAGFALSFGEVDGPSAFARFATPQGIAVDAAGNLFVADTSGVTIRRIAGGVVTTIGGLAWSSGDVAGLGAAARFYGPRALALTPDGNLLVGDTGRLKIGAPSAQPAITVQPQSQSVGAGSSAVFSVSATGGGTLGYQWQKNGTPIPCATASTLTVAPVQSSDAATYTVTVANAVDTLASSGATLTVLAPVPNDDFANARTLGEVAGQTTGTNNGATTEPGEPIHSPVTVTAASVWYKWTPAESGTAVLTLPNTSFFGAIGVWQGSNVASLGRVATVSAPRISVRVQAGGTYYIAVAAGSATRGNFTLAWRIIPNDDSADALTLGGESGSVSGNNEGATGEPGEVVHHPGAAAHSSSLWYRWTPASDGVAIFETSSNLVIAAYEGSNGSVEVTPALRAPAQSNGRSYLYFVARAGTTYRIVVGSHGFGFGQFTLTWQLSRAPVIPLGNAIASASAPVVIASASGVQALAGTPVTLDVGILSATPTTVQWRRDGTPVTAGSQPRFTLPGVQPADAGVYTAVVANAAGAVTSNPVQVSVVTPPPNDNFAAAQGITGLTGSARGTNINATGESGEPPHWNLSGAVSSVWYRWTPTASGLGIVDTVGSGFDTVLAVYTGAELTGLARLVQDDDRGGGRTSQVSFAAAAGTTYHIAVGGSTAGARGTLVLNWQLTPTVAVTAAPVSQIVAIGGSATFTVQASGTGLTYQWFRNGVAIPGATSATLTIGSVQAGQDASFTVRVGNATTTVVSEPATLAVAAPAATSLTMRHVRPQADLLWSIAGGAGELVTVGSFGVILSSSDHGASWTPRHSGTTGWLVAVTYGGGQFVIVGEGGLILTSPDGRGWTRAPSSGTTERINGVIHADGRYVAVGERGIALTSPDGRTWTPRTTPIRTWLHGIAYHPGIRQFATVGEAGVVLVSPDGVTWTRVAVPGYTAALQQIVAVESYTNFVAVGENGMVVSIRRNELMLKDGEPLVTWTAETHPTGLNTHLIGLAQGAGALFATGYDGKVITATSDRGPWYTVPTGTTRLLLAGLFHNDTLYVVGENEAVLQSERLFTSRLINISTRGEVGTGSNLMITGFVVAGDRPKTVLIRAVGPTLGSAFSLTGALSAPTLTVMDSQNRMVTANTGWLTNANPAAITSAAARVGAFPFGVNSADSAVVATLQPGAYTALVAGADNTTGIGLVEVYDADGIANEGSRAINISTRGVAGTGQNKLIAGFIIEGASSRRVLIRAAGPAIAAAPFNVGGTLAEPQLELYNSRGFVHATAGTWGLQQNADEIRSSARAVRAFDFAEGSRDAAMVVTLAPGAWTVQVGGAGEASGVVLVEVYALP